MAEKETQIGRANMNQAPQKPISFKLKDKSVKTKHLADRAVTKETIADGAVDNQQLAERSVSWDKVDDNLKNIITTSGGQHGIPLSTEFGDSNMLGITQKTLSEAIGDVHKDGGDFIPLQQQIDQIVSGQATVSLTANKSAIFVGEDTQVSLTATTDIDASQIKIYKGDVHLGTGSGPRSYTITSREIPQSAGSTTYRAEFTIAGLVKQATRAITAVYPIYYGALASYSSEGLTQLSTPTTTVKGTYTIGLDTTPKKIYFKVPKSNVTGITKVELLSDGNYSPVNGSIDGTLGDENYNVWVSNDAYNVEIAGNRTFVVNR